MVGGGAAGVGGEFVGGGGGEAAVGGGEGGGERGERWLFAARLLGCRLFASTYRVEMVDELERELREAGVWEEGEDDWVDVGREGLDTDSEDGDGWETVDEDDDDDEEEEKWEIVYEEANDEE